MKRLAELQAEFANLSNKEKAERTIQTVLGAGTFNLLSRQYRIAASLPPAIEYWASTERADTFLAQSFPQYLNQNDDLTKPK